MRKDEIDWAGGCVVFWSAAVDDLDLAGDLSEQASSRWFGEDMIQVKYGDDRAIDVGWYPSCSREGRFRVLVIGSGSGTCIQPEDWDRPLFDAETRSSEQLLAILNEAVAVASRQR